MARALVFGHMRVTGVPSYHFALQAWVNAAEGAVIGAQKEGRVFGTDAPRRQPAKVVGRQLPGELANMRSRPRTVVHELPWRRCFVGVVG